MCKIRSEIFLNIQLYVLYLKWQTNVSSRVILYDQDKVMECSNLLTLVSELHIHEEILTTSAIIISLFWVDTFSSLIPSLISYRRIYPVSQ